MAEVPEAAMAAALEAYQATVGLPSDVRVLRVVEAAVRHLAPAPPDPAYRLRQGRSHPANLWSEAAPDWRDHLPAGRMDSAELAAAVCAHHNAMIDFRWLLGRDFGVRVTPYLEFPEGGGTEGAAMLYEVLLSDGEGEQLLTVDGRPSLGEALAEARRRAEEAAREGRPL